MMPVSVDAAELPDASCAGGIPRPSARMLLLSPPLPPPPPTLPLTGWPRPNGVLIDNGAIDSPLPFDSEPPEPRGPSGEDPGPLLPWLTLPGPALLGERSKDEAPPPLSAGTEPADSREIGSDGDGRKGARGGSACCWPEAAGEPPVSARYIALCMPGSDDARRPAAAAPFHSPAGDAAAGGRAVGWNPFCRDSELAAGMGTGLLGLVRAWKRLTGGGPATPHDGEPPVKLPAPLWKEPTAEPAPTPPGENATALPWDCVPCAFSCSADAGVPPPLLLPPGMVRG